MGSVLVGIEGVYNGGEWVPEGESVGREGYWREEDCTGGMRSAPEGGLHWWEERLSVLVGNESVHTGGGDLY